MSLSRSSGSPSWFDESNRKQCGHDPEAHPPTEKRRHIGYSDFGYYRSECGHPECDETWDWYIEG